MANFCKFCGKALQEGEICNCTKQGETSQEVNYNTQNQQEQRPSAPSYFSVLWSFIKNIFKTPFNTSTTLIKNCDFKLALGLIGIYSIVTAFLLISFSMKINGVIEKAAIMGGSEAMVLIDNMKFPTAKIFFVSLILSFGMECLLAVLIMAFTKMFKGNTDFKHMLCVVSIKSTFNVPFILLAIIISLLSKISINISSLSTIMPMAIKAFVIPAVVSTIGSTLALLASYTSLQAGAEISKNRSSYAVYLAFIVMSAVLYFVIKEAVPSCLPLGIQSAIDSAGNIQSIIENMF